MQFAPPSQGRKAFINVTSLIDVMFLVLIFVLMSSTFKTQPAIELDLPSSMSAESVEQGPAILYLTIDGKIYLDDQPVSRADVVEELMRRKDETGDERVLMKADKDSRYQDVLGLVDLIRRSGFLKVGMAAELVGEE